MTLAHPQFLLLVLAVILAAIWVFKGRRDASARILFPGDAALWKSSGKGEIPARFTPLSLKVLALILIVLALCRPQKISSSLSGLGQGIDIMLSIDTSLSMGAMDFEPSNRLGAAQDTAARFIRGRVSDRIGLTIFGGAPQLACPLTLDYDALLSRLDSLSPGETQTDGTAIGDGLLSALKHLTAGDAKSKVIILLTDGRSNAGLVDPLTAAKAAAAYGIKVYTIGTAKEGPALMPFDDPLRGRVLVRIDDDLDEKLLTEIAQLTDGRYFRATNLTELRGIYDTIDRMEKSAVKLPDAAFRRDLHSPIVLAAALLLLAEMALSATWLLRWP